MADSTAKINCCMNGDKVGWFSLRDSFFSKLIKIKRGCCSSVVVFFIFLFSFLITLMRSIIIQALYLRSGVFT